MTGELTPVISSIKDATRLKSNVEICENCNCIIIKRDDEYRGEYFCEHCGYVYDEIYYQKVDIIDIHVENQRLKRELEKGRFKKVDHEKIWRIRALEQKYNGDMKTWRREEYKKFVETPGDHFGMDETQKEKARKMIDLVDDFKKIHRQASYVAIIITYCTKILRDNGRVISFKKPRKNRSFFKKYGLTEKIYNKILENLFNYMLGEKALKK